MTWRAVKDSVAPSSYDASTSTRQVRVLPRPGTCASFLIEGWLTRLTACRSADTPVLACLQWNLR